MEHVGLFGEPRFSDQEHRRRQTAAHRDREGTVQTKLLILDEPTAALNEDDSAHLLGLIKELRDKGITCIIISHKLNEVAEVANSVTIIRDGQSVETIEVPKGERVDEDRIIRGMVGRELSSRYPEHTPKLGDVLFEVEDWTIQHPIVPERLVCKGSTFHIRRGEIVGFAGLMGAGRTELARSLFGRSYGTYLRGTIKMDGRRSRPRASSGHPRRNGVRTRPEGLTQPPGRHQDHGRFGRAVESPRRRRGQERRVRRFGEVPQGPPGEGRPSRRQQPVRW